MKNNPFLRERFILPHYRETGKLDLDRLRGSVASWIELYLFERFAKDPHFLEKKEYPRKETVEKIVKKITLGYLMHVKEVLEHEKK